MNEDANDKTTKIDLNLHSPKDAVAFLEAESMRKNDMRIACRTLQNVIQVHQELLDESCPEIKAERVRCEAEEKRQLAESYNSDIKAYETEIIGNERELEAISAREDKLLAFKDKVMTALPVITWGALILASFVYVGGVKAGTKMPVSRMRALKSLFGLDEPEL